jgi:hypothetical protein
MFKWLKEYNEASSQTKYFVLNWLVYGLAILITTVYCYACLDFVRSYRPPSIAERENIKKAEQQNKTTTTTPTTPIKAKP